MEGTSRELRDFVGLKEAENERTMESSVREDHHSAYSIHSTIFIDSHKSVVLIRR